MAAVAVGHGGADAHGVGMNQRHIMSAQQGTLDIPVVVIPYRDRRAHLDVALARFKDFPVVVVEQCDVLPFNRGSLLNVGFNAAVRRYGATRVLLHDVDLIPDDTLLKMYRDPWPKPVVHFGARFRRYNDSPKYFGGVHGFEVQYFPGYPNGFFGWGGEDDALLKRLPRRSITYARKGEYVDLEGYPTARHKLAMLPGDTKCGNKWELLAADNAREDNHLTLLDNRQEERWVEADHRVYWGEIRHRREA